MARKLLTLVVIILFFGCENKENDIDVSGVEIDYRILRFDEEFYLGTELDSLKVKYPYLFPKQMTDSMFIAKRNDEDERYLFDDSEVLYKDFSKISADLDNLFKHIKYYNPKFSAPDVVTHISGLDYEYPIIFADSLLLISLDMYLGNDNVIYKEFPTYLSFNYKKENIVVDVAKDIIDQSYPKYKSRTFLDRMINEGRSKYLLDRFLPKKTDDLKMGCTPEKINWVENNEAQIWKYYIEHELLYSSDQDLITRFIDVSPFSKFYLETDQESPGQVGVWVGWQIIRSYMKNNDVTLQQMLQTNSEEIFKKSKYKPRK